jgi:hypothetical protein
MRPNLPLTGGWTLLDGPTDKAVSGKLVLQFQPQTRSWNSVLNIQWGGGYESGSAAELVDPRRGEDGCMQPRCWADVDGPIPSRIQSDGGRVECGERIRLVRASVGFTQLSLGS